MTVLVLTAVPASLRGVLTRWLFEIAPGVFVGRVSARVRDLLWDRIVESIGRGRAIMVNSAQNEQHLSFRVHGHDWRPVDFDGVTLMLRPGPAQPSDCSTEPPSARLDRDDLRVDTGGSAPRNWSFAERRLRGR